jgi:hypothetical protein
VRRQTLFISAASVAGLAAAMAVGAIMLWPIPPSRLTMENVALIRKIGWRRTWNDCSDSGRADWRIDREDVETILGPPGDYRTGPTRVLPPDDDSQPGPTLPEDRLIHLRWQGDQLNVRARVDLNGRLRGLESEKVAAVPHGAVETLFWRGSYWWQRWSHWARTAEI